MEYTKPEGASDDSRDNPLSKNIILRRLVSRIDMERVEVEDDAVKTGMGENFDQLLVDGLNSALTDKVETLKKQQNVAAGNCDNLLKLLKEKVGTKDTENTIAGDNYADYINELVNTFNKVANDSSLVSSWTAFTASEFTFKSMHNRMSINDLTSSYDNSITSRTYTYPITEGKATWIGFACNEAAKMPFTGIKLSGSKSTGDNIETIELNLSFTQEDIFLQKNGLVTYTCNPIAEIKPKGGAGRGCP